MGPWLRMDKNEPASETTATQHGIISQDYNAPSNRQEPLPIIPTVVSERNAGTRRPLVPDKLAVFSLTPLWVNFRAHELLLVALNLRRFACCVERKNNVSSSPRSSASETTTRAFPSYTGANVLAHIQVTTNSPFASKQSNYPHLESSTPFQPPRTSFRSLCCHNWDTCPNFLDPDSKTCQDNFSF